VHGTPAFEPDRQPLRDRGAGAKRSAPRSTPLAIVSGAVAGGDLQTVASSASEALRRPIVIAIPALGDPVVSGTLADSDVRSIVEHASAAIEDETATPPAAVATSVVVRVGREVIGIVAAGHGPDRADPQPDERAWLDGAAAAAAVSALLLQAPEGDLEGSRRALLHTLAAGPPADVPALLADALRLGVDLSHGAVALCARGDVAGLPCPPGAVLATVGGGRVLGVIAGPPEPVVDELAASGLKIALSAPRRDAAALHEAVREAELLLELAPLSGQDETYRLLIGVLLRDPDEVGQLQASTISPLVEYDAGHDTELLATLQEFLAHHGSTTETAEAMGLHRHTVGYRLARVHEVSGLSPYESDGRERLSLGLKALQILAAEERRNQSATT
jgi:hypothetical protein